MPIAAGSRSSYSRAARSPRPRSRIGWATRMLRTSGKPAIAGSDGLRARCESSGGNGRVSVPDAGTPRSAVEPASGQTDGALTVHFDPVIESLDRIAELLEKREQMRPLVSDGMERAGAGTRDVAIRIDRDRR